MSRALGSGWWGESGSVGPAACAAHKLLLRPVCLHPHKRPAHGSPDPSSLERRPCSIADELRDEDQYLFDLNHFHVLQEMEVGRAVG